MQSMSALFLFLIIYSHIEQLIDPCGHLIKLCTCEQVGTLGSCSGGITIHTHFQVNHT